MDDFGLLEAIWTILVIYALLFLLMALVMILVDLFRDHELSGWWKAAWVIVLLVVPIIGSLTYLIVRGGGMAERAMRQRRASKAELDSAVRQAAGVEGPAQEIAAAKELLDAGAISDEEFERLKARALA